MVTSVKPANINISQGIVCTDKSNNLFMEYEVLCEPVRLWRQMTTTTVTDRTCLEFKTTLPAIFCQWDNTRIWGAFFPFKQKTCRSRF